MTPTEKAKRSEALYYDNHNITRRTLCDRVVNLESDMEEIKNKNTRLRAKLRELVPELCEQNAALHRENAKLRELVRDYEHCSMHADCDSCKYDGTTSTHCPFSPCFPDIDELSELGVEVDE